ncbi:MAG TPA: hypothetical protein VGF56_11205 [Rhizomicrobium sp.]
MSNLNSLGLVLCWRSKKNSFILGATLSFGSVTHKKSIQALLAIAVGTFGLTSCGNETVGCLPPGTTAPSERWKSEPDALPVSRVENARVYFDLSASMRGFVPSARVLDLAKSPLSLNFTRSLPNTLRELSKSGSSKFEFFGGVDEHLNVSEAEFLRFTSNPKAYTYLRTDIPAVLNEVRSQPTDELDVVVTDLFFNDREVGSGGTGLIATSLRGLMQQGRSIGLLGIASPFDGEIYDIPPNSARVRYRGTRPLFAIVIGPAASVSEFVAKTREALLVDRPAGALNAILFTPTPLQPHGKDITGYVVRDGDVSEDLSGVHSNYAHLIEDKQGNLLWQGHLSASDSNGTIRVRLPLGKIYWSDAIRPSASRFEASATMRLSMFAGIPSAGRDSSTCNALWQKIEPAPKFLSAHMRSADDLDLGISPASRAQDIQRQRPYFAEIVLSAPAPRQADLPGWLHDWSFDDASSARVVASATSASSSTLRMFPIYRLDILAGAIVETQRENWRDSVIADIKIAFVLE